MDSNNTKTWLGEALNWLARWTLRAWYGLVILTFMAGVFMVYTYGLATVKGYQWEVRVTVPK